MQSVVFFIDKGWTIKKAKVWLKNHNIVPMKNADRHLKNQLRFRLEDPKKYKRFITKKLEPGVNLIVGYK